MGCSASHFGWRLSTALQPGKERVASVRQRDRQGVGPRMVGILREDFLPCRGDPAAIREASYHMRPSGDTKNSPSSACSKLRCTVNTQCLFGERVRAAKP